MIPEMPNGVGVLAVVAMLATYLAPVVVQFMVAAAAVLAVVFQQLTL
jgi:hypothetical protein